MDNATAQMRANTDMHNAFRALQDAQDMLDSLAVKWISYKDDYADDIIAIQADITRIQSKLSLVIHR